MGVAGLWELLRPASKTRSLTELAVTEGFEANPDNVRGYRVGIDASIWFFHAEYGREGENPVLRTLFFRCATLMRAPFLPLFVFDGPKRPDFKRGKKINKTSHKLIPGMKAIVESFGFEWRMAPGEAEAELAYLNRMKIIDGILSDDVDNFLFGATTVIRNPSNNLSGNRANPVVNAAGKDDKNHTKVYRLTDISEHPDVRLTRGGMILIGLMKGGDYHPGGLVRCGPVIAHGLAKCGFGDSLYQAAKNLTRDELAKFLISWRHELRHELLANSQGHIGKKQPALAKAIPDHFPDIDILLSYTNPITSESMGRAVDGLRLTWGKEPDLGKLAATCEFYFEWGYKEAIIKRFRTVIWHAAVLRILRRAVLDLDVKRGTQSRTLLATPRKGNRLEPQPVGTPSKMIAKHFSSLTLGALEGCARDCDDDHNKRLIVKVHSCRNHLSTDGILEYRLEIAPAQLVHIAESGIKGTRAPDGPDEWADDNDEDDEGKKPPPDPETHLRVWMPACMVRLVEPGLVEDFEAGRDRKRTKKSAKSHPKVRSKVEATVNHVTRERWTSEEEELYVGQNLDDVEPLANPTKVPGALVLKRASSAALSGLSPSSGSHAPATEQIPERVIRDLTKKREKNVSHDARVDIKSFFATVKPSEVIARKTRINSSSTSRQLRESAKLAEPDISAGGSSLSHPRSSSSVHKTSALKVSRVPSSSGMAFADDEDLFLSDDPFDDRRPASSSVNMHSCEEAQLPSPETNSHVSSIRKSLRNPPYYTSTHPQRSQDNGNASSLSRPCPPPPLYPPTKKAVEPSTRFRDAATPQVIEISSDSDNESDNEVKPNKIDFPLAIARARTNVGIRVHRELYKPKGPCCDDVIDLT